jgi:hypothetical protein
MQEEGSQLRKLQLVLAAGLASGLTALATFVGFAETAPAVVPENTEPPMVVGTPQDGELVAAKDGEWAGEDPAAFTYQWQGCDAAGANCASISGATGKIYRVATTDVGKRLRVQVTAKNATGSTSATAQPTSAVVHPAGAQRLADGRYSIPATSVKMPDRLIISGVEFSPTVLRSRAPFTGRFRVTDTRGYVVRDATVLVTGVPLGWIRQPAEVKTSVDGLVTIQLQPTPFLRLVRSGSLVMFIRARKEGDSLLAGISSRRLVRVRTARPSS